MIRTSPSSLVRVCCALAAITLLGGCVAAVAVPVLTAVGAATEKERSRAEVVAALPAANAATLAALSDPDGDTSVQLTALTELPPPSGSGVADRRPWDQFASFAVARAADLAAEGEAVSALLTAESAINFRTEMRPCTTQEPAVVIDLDPAETIFAADAAGSAVPEAAAAAARLREAGVIVLWVSQASANEVAAVADALQSTGLDPTGRDPILLVRDAEERKQVLRVEANQTVCVLAIAGDERSDFDELFDYLRDPTVGTLYDGQLGSGWFIVPPPFGASTPGLALPVVPAGEDGGR